MAMYRFAYSAICDNPQHPLASRRPQISDAIELLEAANVDASTHQSVEALSHLRRLWPLVIEDLCGPEYQLPAASRAGLEAVGRFVLDEVDQIRFGKSRNVPELIVITRSIAEKLA
jgi:flagellar protein FlaF